ncbi:MAG: GAF domain-containing sensor histidine kinase [Candidatus Omnitrophica bacterium]|nr:GAF domain-containing sensor histidine kinase [Candidatus Omnitrophota bacterium]
MNPVPFPLEDVGTKDGSESAMLSDYSVAVHTLCDPSVLIDFALDSILALVDATRGSFFVWDEFSKELVLKAARGQGRERIQGVTIKLRDGVGGWVADKGQPVLVTDIRQDSRFLDFRKTYSYQSHSFLSLPLVANNKLVGLINITERENKYPFTQKEFEHAQALAAHIAIAYQNLKTTGRLQKENEALGHTTSDLKEMMKEDELLVALGKSLAHLGHELANPLDAVRRFVNLALDQVGEESPARNYLLKAKQGIRRTIQVIRGIRELAQVNSKGKTPRRIEIHSLLQETINTTSEDPVFSQISIVKQFCEGSIFVDDCGLQTVFQNLFQNAHHAMNGVGSIAVSTAMIDGNAKQVVISVRDSGHGVPEQIKGRIFEPFFTTKDNGQGTGIGLAICKEIIQRSGGQISCESKENQGTEFIIAIPCQS